MALYFLFLLRLCRPIIAFRHRKACLDLVFLDALAPQLELVGRHYLQHMALSGLQFADLLDGFSNLYTKRLNFRVVAPVA